jgi:phospholipase/carboxylesterase
MAITSITNRKIGPLKAIEVGEAKNGPTIVLFHGYGASGSDLAPVSAETPLDFPARWIFPDAPLRTDFGGLAWFPIDAEAINRAQETGIAVDFASSEPPALEEARKTAEKFLEALDVPSSQLILGGFSQGSMLATDLALNHKEAPAGLVILSGNLINEKSWAAKAKNRGELKFFQSHGIADPVLGFSGARRLYDLLSQNGLHGEFFKFEGGHSIPLEVLEALGDWIDGLKI